MKKHQHSDECWEPDSGCDMGRNEAHVRLPYQFDPKATWGDRYGRAMEMKTKADADEYFERLVQSHLKVAPERSREEVEELERNNLGYFAGYYSAEVRERIERLFKCEHPIFGSIAKNGQPTAEEALLMGLHMDRRAREGR